MRTVWWEDGTVRMIDQRKLPAEYEVARWADYHGVARGIQEMYVRGAPAIGAAAAFGLAVPGFLGVGEGLVLHSAESDLGVDFDGFGVCRGEELGLEDSVPQSPRLAGETLTCEVPVQAVGLCV